MSEISIFKQVRAASKFVTATQARQRTVSDVFACTTSELGELGEEIAIQNGYSYKDEGADGIVGEAIDTILCLYDLINVQTKGEITEEEVNRLAARKLRKWTTNVENAERANREQAASEPDGTARLYQAIVHVTTTQRSGWDCDDCLDVEEYYGESIEEVTERARKRVDDINGQTPAMGDFGIILRSSKAKLLGVRTIGELVPV